MYDVAKKENTHVSISSIKKIFNKLSLENCYHIRIIAVQGILNQKFIHTITLFTFNNNMRQKTEYNIELLMKFYSKRFFLSNILEAS